MADNAATGGSGLTDASRDALEARIRALEAQLESKERELERAERESAQDDRQARRRAEVRDNVEASRDVTYRTFDEASRLFRALTQAHIEGLRAVTDTVGTFADEVSKRRDAKDRDRDSLADLPNDILRRLHQGCRRGAEDPRAHHREVPGVRISAPATMTRLPAPSESKQAASRP